MQSTLHGTQQINMGQTGTFNIPSTGWISGMMWPKVGCDGSGNNCLFGQSRAPCPSTGCTPPAETKAEFTIPAVGSGQSWYDVTLVDGYSLPMKITPRVAPSGSCIPTNCAVDLNRCPTAENNLGDLRYIRNGKVLACLSPCKKYTWPAAPGMGQSESTPTGQAMCCPNPMSPATCQAGAITSTQYVGLIHSTCPTAYSYSYDDMHGLHYCDAATSFDITVC